MILLDCMRRCVSCVSSLINLNQELGLVHDTGDSMSRAVGRSPRRILIPGIEMRFLSSVSIQSRVVLYIIHRIPQFYTLFNYLIVGGDRGMDRHLIYLSDTPGGLNSYQCLSC